VIWECTFPSRHSWGSCRVLGSSGHTVSTSEVCWCLGTHKSQVTSWQAAGALVGQPLTQGQLMIGGNSLDGDQPTSLLACDLGPGLNLECLKADPLKGLTNPCAKFYPLLYNLYASSNGALSTVS
jgi:hypothetical protein